MKARAKALTMDVPRAILFAAFMALFAIAASGCDNSDDGLGRNGQEGFCCDCTCGDGAGPCLNTIVDGDGSASCAVVCEDACAASTDCSALEEAQVCSVAPDGNGKGDDICQRNALGDQQCL